MNAFLEQYRPHLRRLAEHQLSKLGGDAPDPSDVVQEVLLRGYRQQDQFRGSTPQQLAAWLEEILRNQIADAVKHARRARRDVRRERPLFETACPRSSTGSEIACERESHELVQRALGSLPEVYREVLLLRQQSELTFEEIGRRLNRRPDAARMLWGRAIIALGELLKPHE
jgi:RNA polymerase sigma-70 factor, ECF subfamily